MATRTLNTVLIVWMAAAAATLPACAPADTHPAPTIAAQAAGAPAPRPERNRSNRATVGFRSPRQMEEHYRKHGQEFGHVTQEEYLARAQRLRDAEVGGNVLEIIREDGVITRFDRSTGAFIAFDRDGTIRTFFRPNVGESYFRRQARRPEHP